MPSARVDRLYLDAAIELAERGLFTASPNPRVGCVFVRDGQILGRGWHIRTGGPHAEVEALDDAAKAGRDVAGATAYVSLEPCAHHGRTPPCADALIRAGVARVVIAAIDPNPEVAGKSVQKLRDEGIRVDVDERPEAAALNAGYFLRNREDRPFVRLKVGMSLDGRTAMASGESQWITGAAARADVQYWRARSCAVVTGIGTVIADDPSLNVRDTSFADVQGIRQPLRVVVDSAARTPPDAKIFDSPGRVLVACGARAARSHPKAELYAQSGERVDLEALLRHLAAMGCNEVLVEAGAELLGAFIQEGLWDELIAYVAPKLLGSDARPLARLGLSSMSESIEGRIAGSAMVGDDLRVVVSRV